MSKESEVHHFNADNTASQGGFESNKQKQRNIGLGLVAVSFVVVFLTAYMMWVKTAYVADQRNYAERIRPYWMFAGLIIMLAFNMFLAGLFLLKSSYESDGRTIKARLLAKVLYITGSINIGLLAAFLDITRFKPAAFLAYFTCLPTIIFRTFANPVSSIIGSNSAIAYTILILFYVIFYICFFYPLYKRQYAAMGIFAAIILGIGFLILIIVMTLNSME